MALIHTSLASPSTALTVLNCALSICGISAMNGTGFSLKSGRVALQNSINKKLLSLLY